MSTTTTISTIILTLNAPKEQKTDEPYRYAHLLPVPSPQTYPPLTPFQHSDPGHRALSLPDPRAFLKNASSVVELTPNLGTEVTGVSLLKLDSSGRDQLALEVARRGLMVFRDQQDFIDAGYDFYRQWGQHFGRLHIHPVSGHPENMPEIHLVYKDANTTYDYHGESITATAWHSDVSYELQPPGVTTFFLLSQPKTGGDTLFTSQVSVLKRLSPQFIAFLRTLKAVHSGVEQANHARNVDRAGGIVRREPVQHVHPVVRRHPVTGQETLYVNSQFTRRIVGFKKEESDAILNFLYDHIAKSADLQARVKWTPNTVVLWDNRVTAHSAISNYPGERRHGARITPQAERPIPADPNLVLDD